ncbi:UDP-N-acetylmuramoyl-L-alanyl-D-glutamate--2,6-diaminopimelate ligase [Patescibacteria group bacterium]|nr:UDP-N-acetylmuramoyl-L-alanyl-D-glutamate--2,6-diaminopimelate ligase [Patescibacteria group bacterium]
MPVFLKRIVPRSIVRFFGPAYHWALARLAAYWYGYPSRGMTVIGITGTNGKSTVVELSARILEEARFRVASVSSIRFKIMNEWWPNDLKMTMPGRFFLQRFLARAKRKGATHVVLEVTSQGIKQFRHRGIEWDVLLLTNITREHIEAHGSFEKYQKTKEKVFEQLIKTYRKKEIPKIIIVNEDDKHALEFLKYNADKKLKYSLKNIDYILEKDGIKITIEDIVIKTKLSGRFNIYNIMAAITLARSLNIGWEEIQRAISKIDSIPGRFEFIQHEPFTVVVDYAHTPDALRKVYEALKNNNLICVLGAAGGGRDKWKRRELGQIADEFCKEIILTNEDPYDEDPNQILSEIESGISAKPVLKILDREEAIKKAILNVRSGDAVIITGKGSESWMMGPRGTKLPWDDRNITREVLKARDEAYGL